MKYKLLEEQDISLMLDFVDDENTNYNKEALHNFIQNNNNVGFIAKINNKIVGFAFGYNLLKPDGRKVFYLDAIDIMPEYQNKGYGTGLISFARDYAKSINCYKMYLITNRSNISACTCYEKAGGINKADDEVVYVYNFKEKNNEFKRDN
ncbi:MAG: GNAT family N-acetyltransferase [Bacilli bacterium]|nr:GNAT family N-acetyltransferase [Bacilli bacterium]